MADNIAYNPQTGEAIKLVNGQWQPLPVAKNPRTGEIIAHDGSDWVRLSEAPPKAGLGAQGFNDAVANLVGMPVDAATWALKQAGVQINNPILGSDWNKQALDYVATAPSRALDTLKTGSTAPLTDERSSRAVPRTEGEKIAYGVGSGVGNVVASLIPAGAVAQGAGSFGPVTRAVAGEMAQAPLAQIGAGAVGGAVGEVTGNPWLGIGAGVLTGAGLNTAQRALPANLRPAPPAAAIPSSVAPGSPTGPGFYEALKGNAPLIPDTVKMTDAERAAAQVMARALQRDADARGVKQPLAQAADEMQALGPESMLADVGGRNMQGKVRSIANAPGAGATTIEDALLARKAGEGTRTENLATALAGQTNRAAQTADDLAKQRGAAAQPLYEKAFAGGPITSDRIQQFMSDPIIKQGISKGIEVQRLESLASGKPFNPKDYAITAFNEAGEPMVGQVPNMRLLDSAKRGLDEILEQYRDKVTGRLVLDQRGRAIDQVRQSLLKELDALNPDYAAARAAWAGPSKAMDAMSWGQQAMTGGRDPYLVAKQYAGMTDAEKEAARLGVADWMRKAAGETQRGSPMEKIFGNTRNQANNAAERLKIIFGDDFGKIREAAAAEAAFNKTVKNLSVSATKPLADESVDTLGMIRAGASAARGSPTGIAEALMRVGPAIRARVGVGAEEVQAAAAKMATAQSPEEKARALQMLARALMKEGQGPSLLAPSAAYAASQAPSAVQGRR